MKKAILGCSVFYDELQQVTEDHNDITLKLLPQGLHDMPDETRMQEKLQQGIDELESSDDFDRIILAYGFCSGGVEGIEAENAELVIPMMHDCIPLLSGSQQAEGRVDGSATYYLSRGWIDCGGDTYRQHLAMTGELDRWVERFREYEQNDSRALVEWPEIDQYQDPNQYGEEMAEQISFQCMKSYEAIVLIDNGNLERIHYDYAEEMHEFIDDLLRRNRGKGLEFKVREGDLSLLKKLVFLERYSDAEAEDLALITPPATPLRLEEKII